MQALGLPLPANCLLHDIHQCCYSYRAPRYRPIHLPHMVMGEVFRHLRGRLSLRLSWPLFSPSRRGDGPRLLRFQEELSAGASPILRSISRNFCRYGTVYLRAEDFRVAAAAQVVQNCRQILFDLLSVVGISKPKRRLPPPYPPFRQRSITAT